MIEYAKKILPKVSPWKPLFSKELKKCIQWIEPEDHYEFYEWCYVNFFNLYPDVISDAFEDLRINRMKRSVTGLNLKSAVISAKKSELQNTA